MNMRWLLQMKRWVDRPPSWSRVKFVFYIILACAMLYAYEYFYGWPDFLTLENGRYGRAIPKF